MNYVMKFGGTSLSNAKNFLKVFKIIKKKKKKKIAIVLSAPSKITNFLIKSFKKAKNKKNFYNSLKKSKKKIQKIVKILYKKKKINNFQAIKKKIKKKFSKLKNILNKIKYQKKSSDYQYAQISSAGEYFSVLIMKKIFLNYKISTTILKPEKFILIKKKKNNKIADLKNSKKNFQKIKIKKKSILLMPGFIAGNKKKKKITLGRNGSDYSASILSVCLNAKKCEIWTDVNGIYTCDPKIIPNSKIIKKISYKNTIKFSKIGAKVIHPKTILPLKKFNISCYVRNTFNPKNKGTLVSNFKNNKKKEFFGISKTKKINLIKIRFSTCNKYKNKFFKIIKNIKKNKNLLIYYKINKNNYKLHFAYKKNKKNRIKKIIFKKINFKKRKCKNYEIKTFKNISMISIIYNFKNKKFSKLSKIYDCLNSIKKSTILINKNSKKILRIFLKKKNIIPIINKIYFFIFTKKKFLEIFLIGTGKIATTLLEQIKKEKKNLNKKNIKIKLICILNSKKMLFNIKGIKLNKWKIKLLKNNKKSSIKKLKNYFIKTHYINPVLIDCTSSNNISKQYNKFLSLGFNIITPNKKANTRNYKYYKKIRNTAKQKKLKFFYETNVGGGLPIIQTLKKFKNTGDKLIKFRGILSGSLSYIFGKMENGLKFSEAVKKAYLKGLTEPDPREDLSGIDVSRKLLIISREIGKKIELKDIKIIPIIPKKFNSFGKIKNFLKNIKKLDNFFEKKIIKLKKTNKKIKFIGEINKNNLPTVKLCEINKKDPLFNIKNGENAFSFYTTYYQPKPLVIRGYGAGKIVTASGVFNDLLKII